MKFQLPHWVAIVSAVLAAVLASLAQQAQFAAYAGVLNSFALIVGSLGTTVALHAPSIVPAANIQAVKGYTLAEERSAKTDARGFVSLRPLLTLLSAGALILAVACAAFRSAEPQVQTLLQCVETYVEDNLTVDFETLAIGAAFKCGADVFDVLAQIVTSLDPNLAQYKPAARAAMQDPAQLTALRSKVALRRAGHGRDAGAAR